METVELAKNISMIAFACSGVFFVAAAILFWKLGIPGAIRILSGRQRKKNMESYRKKGIPYHTQLLSVGLLLLCGMTALAGGDCRVNADTVTTDTSTTDTITSDTITADTITADTAPEIKNESEAKTEDENPPVITTPGFEYDGEWTNQSFSIPVEVTDEESGIESVTYRLGDEEKVVWTGKEKITCSFSIPIDADYNGSCVIEAKDQCGNRAVMTRTIRFDQTAPEIKAISRIPEKEYYNDEMKIQVQVEDQGSGAATIFYTRQEKEQMQGDTGSTSAVNSTSDGSSDASSTIIPEPDENNPIQISEDGIGEIPVPGEEFDGIYYIWAEDALGNRTASFLSIEIHIDKTLPVVESVDTTLNQHFFSNQPIAVTIKARDNQSYGTHLQVYLGKQAGQNKDSDTVQAVYQETTKTYKVILGNEKVEYQNQTFAIWAEDEAGNRSDVSEILVNLDRTKPNVTGILFEEENTSTLKSAINRLSFGTFFNENVRVKVTANDNQGGAGIKKITLYVKSGSQEETWKPLTNPVLFENIEGSQEVTAEFVLTRDILDGLGWDNQLVSLEEMIYAVAEDGSGTETESGNVSDPLNGQLLVLEQNAPKITVRTKNQPDATVSWNGQSYPCYGKDTKLQITAVDTDNQIGTVQSGIWKIKVTVNGAVVIDQIYETQRSTTPDSITIDTANLKDTGGNSVTVDEDGFFHIQAETTDYAGNQGQQTLDFCMDYDAPVISALEKTPSDAWSAGKVTVQAKGVRDTRKAFVSQVKEVRYSTGTDVSKAKTAKKISDTVYQFEEKEEGEWTYSVWAIDQVGHVSKRKEIAVKIDKTPPEIVQFSFQPKGQQESSGTDLNNIVETTDYGFYFRKAVKVTVTANDAVADGKNKTKPASGVKYIEYFAVNQNGTTAVSGKKEVNSKNEITFTVPADFKGQIYAKATDQVGNTPKDKENTKDVDEGYVHPDGSIVESAKQHKKTSEITLDWTRSSKKDTKGQDLYRTNVPVEITVEDSFSGIRTVEWSVTSDYDTEKNQKGTLDISGSGSLGGDTKGWSVKETDQNLVTRVKKKITVSNNSNDITVWVQLTDRAGNTSKKSIQFSIDKTAPSIEVTYDNHSYDSKFASEKQYYKAGRTATITVTERNFSEKDVICTIKNATGTAPKLGDWTRKADRENPDQTTYTTTISYQEDGDYSFSISYQDLAGNRAAQPATDQFVIDKTAPLIQVTYDNQEAKNGTYYQKSRTATITVTEQNFETSRFELKGEAKRDGEAISFPKLSKWKTKGKEHTATLSFTEDGTYGFSISYTDKAGNQASPYQQASFTVDQTKPLLVLSGVENESANKGEVRPVVTWSDRNLDGDAEITLTAANQKGKISYKGTATNIANGKKYTFSDFAHKKETDDIYTLKAAVKDKAGNTAEQTIRFSVNRFGSVYTLEEETQNLNGTYLNRERDVILTETNVDQLKNETVEVKVIKDGTAKNLVESEDYTVVKSEQKGSWSQYCYTIYAANFSQEGQYEVAVSSEDRAGNINETTDESRGVHLAFGIDKTPPVIVPMNVENGATYAENGKQVLVDVTDNFVLQGVTAALNGEEADIEKSDSGYAVFVDQSNQKQSLKITAVDAAGNHATQKVENFYVTTSFFVRWYTNPVLLVGSVAVLAGVLLGIFLLYFFRIREQEALEEENS